LDDETRGMVEKMMVRCWLLLLLLLLVLPVSAEGGCGEGLEKRD
jgi:hypothetical protein